MEVLLKKLKVNKIVVDQITGGISKGIARKWIKYYNEERIVVALKTSPLKYRMTKLLNSV